MPGADSIVIYKGEDVTLSFTMDPVEDISGWTIAFNAVQDGVVVLTKSATITSGEDGEFTVALTDDDTDDLGGSYLYDVWRTDAGSETVLARNVLDVLGVAREVG